MFMDQNRGRRLIERQPALRAVCLCVPALASMVLAPVLARAGDSSPVTTTAGYEYYAGPDHQLTRTASGEVEGKILGATASILGGRVDDAGAGVGFDVGAGLGLAIAPRTQFKLEAEHARVDSGYVAWTLKAGPAFELPRGQALSLKYVRIADNESAVTNGATAELESPLIPNRLSGTGTLSYTKLQDLSGVEGAAGLSWTPVDHVEIEGDAGYTETGISLNSLFSSKHVIKANQAKQQGKKGATTSTGLEKSPGMIAQVAVRFSFP
jgi:hypothetical protein